MNAALPTGRAGRLLALSILALLLALLWLAGAQPLLDWYAARAASLRDQAAMVARETALSAELPELEHASRGTPSAATLNRTFLDADTDAIAGAILEQRLQAMTGQIGANLSSAEALTPQIDGAYHRIELKVSVASDWPTFVKLLRTVTTGEPTMLVDDLSLTGTASPIAGATPIGATFTVIAFRNATVHASGQGAGAGPAAP